MRAAAGAALLALSCGSAARAELATLPPATDLAQTGWCDANLTTTACASATGLTTAYTAFTVSQRSQITGFEYYSIFTDASYVSTNWSILTGASTPTETASSGATPPVGAQTSYANIGGLELIQVTLDPGAYVTLEPGAQYWIGIQNNVALLNDDGTSVYASLNSPPAYRGGALFDGTTTIAGGGGWTLSAYDPNWQYWPWPNAGLAIQTKSAPAAPEPATWAMMLTGFAALAWAARRRLSRRAA